MWTFWGQKEDFFFPMSTKGGLWEDCLIFVLFCPLFVFLHVTLLFEDTDTTGTIYGQGVNDCGQSGTKEGHGLGHNYFTNFIR